MRVEVGRSRWWVKSTPSGREKRVPLNKAEELACDIIGEVESWVETGRDADVFEWLVREVASIAFGAETMTCGHCRDKYLTGPLTGRRSHSVYCSDACRKAAAREGMPDPA